VEVLAGHEDAWTLSLGHLWALAEVVILQILGTLVLAIVAGVSYAVKYFSGAGEWTQRVIIGASGIASLLAPMVVIERVGLTSKMARFQLSIFAILAFFRLVELLRSCGPKGFNMSARNFVIYCAASPEVMFDKEGQLVKVPPGKLVGIIYELCWNSILILLCLSIGRATNYAPLLTVEDPLALPLFGFPYALPSSWLQAASVYLMLYTSFTGQRLLIGMGGFDSAELMRNPLLRSTSVRDFWGRRWNLLIHSLMKRIFFKPLASGSRAKRHAGALAAFAASGLFHEYMWLVLSWESLGDSYWPGGPSLFFLVQFLLAACEASLEQTALGRMLAAMPSPVQTLCTTLAILPFGPAFLSGLRGMFLDNVAVLPTIGSAPHPRAFFAVSLRGGQAWMPMLLVLILATASFCATSRTSPKASPSEDGNDNRLKGG